MVRPRLDDPGHIEQRLLDFAYTTDADITASALAYFAPCSIEDAQKVLDDLAAHDRLTLDVRDDGSLHYHLPNRQRLALAPPRPVHTPLVRYHHGTSPAVAAVLSLVIPGAGQAYAGHWIAGLLWFFVVGAGYSLIVPGLLLHLICIATAATTADRERRLLPSGP